MKTKTIKLAAGPKNKKIKLLMQSKQKFSALKIENRRSNQNEKINEIKN